MAYQGGRSHSPSYDDAQDAHDGHRLQDVPASQVRVGNTRQSGVGADVSLVPGGRRCRTWIALPAPGSLCDSF